jgi:proteic killer suppression protein
MDIAFESTRLRRTFNSTRRLTRKYGVRLATRIVERLTILEEARNLADVPHGPPMFRHQLEHDSRGQFAIRLTESDRLILEPNHDPLPLLDDGGVDISKVTAIVIIEVVNYHSS